MSERDLRNAILLLVKAHKMRQSQWLAIQILLAARVDASSSQTPGLSLADIERELPSILAQTGPEADAEAQQVEAALNGQSDFLEELQAYASRQFWTTRQD
jgi:hypothetical protein